MCWEKVAGKRMAAGKWFAKAGVSVNRTACRVPEFIPVLSYLVVYMYCVGAVFVRVALNMRWIVYFPFK